MINFELPKSLKNLQNMTHQLAEQGFRPISRKYDRIEHGDTPAELKPLAQMIAAGRPRGGGKSDKADADPEAVKNGSNLMGIVSVEEMCWGDTGLMLSLPASGLGNAAIQAVGTAEQKEQYGKLYCAMAIRPPRRRRVGAQRRENLLHRRPAL